MYSQSTLSIVSEFFKQRADPVEKLAEIRAFYEAIHIQQCIQGKTCFTNFQCDRLRLLRGELTVCDPTDMFDFDANAANAPLPQYASAGLLFKTLEFYVNDLALEQLVSEYRTVCTWSFEDDLSQRVQGKVELLLTQRHKTSRSDHQCHYLLLHDKEQCTKMVRLRVSANPKPSAQIMLNYLLTSPTIDCEVTPRRISSEWGFEISHVY
jgi:hypothetical protein